MGQHQDDTSQEFADLADIAVGAMEGFTPSNNGLMKGKDYNGTGDLGSYFKDGTFLAFPGLVKNTVNYFHECLFDRAGYESALADTEDPHYRRWCLWRWSRCRVRLQKQPGLVW